MPRYTLVRHPDYPKHRGLAIRPVAPEDERRVRRWGGFLFDSEAEAERFAEGEMVYGKDGPPLAAEAFGKEIGGARIYVRVDAGLRR